jgi:hypothetical protein
MKVYRAGIILIILFVSIMSVWADQGSSGLVINSLKEEGGYIFADLTVTPLMKIDDKGGFLSLWFYPSGTDCTTARLLGWRHISRHDEGTQVIMKSPVPATIIAGTYSVSAHYNAGISFPSACDSKVSATSTLSVTTPGKAGLDMTSILSETTEREGPLYQIESISGVDTTIRREPGETLSPTITVKNTGSDDNALDLVEVHAFLGSETLIPISGFVKPLKSGETETVNLVYQVPGTIPLQSYPFFMIIDPFGVHSPAGAPDSLKKTGGKMTIRTVEPDLDCGCK